MPKYIHVVITRYVQDVIILITLFALDLFFAEHNASRKNTVPKIFSKSSFSLRGVACFCSTEFCIECNEFPHWPASCQQIKSYVKALDIQNGESEIQRKQIHNKKEKENCD